MSAIASQITSFVIDYSSVYSGADQRSKKTSKLRVTGLCEENSPVTGEIPAQRASNAENVSIWWRHHEHIIWLLAEFVGIGKQVMWQDQGQHKRKINKTTCFMWLLCGFPWIMQTMALCLWSRSAFYYHMKNSCNYLLQAPQQISLIITASVCCW